jgi:hypothetical protein
MPWARTTGRPATGTHTTSTRLLPVRKLHSHTLVTASLTTLLVEDFVSINQPASSARLELVQFGS